VGSVKLFENLFFASFRHAHSTIANFQFRIRQRLGLLTQLKKNFLSTVRIFLSVRKQINDDLRQTIAIGIHPNRALRQLAREPEPIRLKLRFVALNGFTHDFR